eukprot:815853-Heterocapsa_arctica.AAC.1
MTVLCSECGRRRLIRCCGGADDGGCFGAVVEGRARLRRQHAEGGLELLADELVELLDARLLDGLQDHDAVGLYGGLSVAGVHGG